MLPINQSIGLGNDSYQNFVGEIQKLSENRICNYKSVEVYTKYLEGK
jgi:hypothetical protein